MGKVKKVSGQAPGMPSAAQAQPWMLTLASGEKGTMLDLAVIR